MEEPTTEKPQFFSVVVQAKGTKHDQLNIAVRTVTWCTHDRAAKVQRQFGRGQARYISSTKIRFLYLMLNVIETARKQCTEKTMAYL